MLTENKQEVIKNVLQAETSQLSYFYSPTMSLICTVERPATKLGFHLDLQSPLGKKQRRICLLYWVNEA